MNNKVTLTINPQGENCWNGFTIEKLHDALNNENLKISKEALKEILEYFKNNSIEKERIDKLKSYDLTTLSCILFYMQLFSLPLSDANKIVVFNS